MSLDGAYDLAARIARIPRASQYPESSRPCGPHLFLDLDRYLRNRLLDILDKKKLRESLGNHRESDICSDPLIDNLGGSSPFTPDARLFSGHACCRGCRFDRLLQAHNQIRLAKRGRAR